MRYKQKYYKDVKQYDREGNLVGEYANIEEAIDKTGLPYHSIYNAMIGKIGYTYGYRFTAEKVVLPRRKDIDFEVKSLKNMRSGKERYCLMCNRKFRSKGPHNYRCYSCNNKVQNDRAYDIKSPVKSHADGKSPLDRKDELYPVQYSGL